MKPMLASPASENIKFPVYASYKLDGVRCLIYGGKAVSRALKPIPNFHIQDYLGNQVLNGLDGELIVGKPNDCNVMQATTSGVMSREGIPDFTYYIFDFYNNINIGFAGRFAMMEQGIRGRSPINDPKIRLLDHVLVKNKDELLSYEEQALSLGYEGIMIRDPNGLYKHGRSTAKEGLLLKIKRFKDAEAVIIGVEELMQNNNPKELDNLGYASRSSHQANKSGKNCLGALIVKDIETGG